MKSDVYFEDIRKHIQVELRKAKNYVFVAVAWLTDDVLFGELVNLSKKAIQVQLLLNDDEINNNSGLDYSILFRNGGMVFFINSGEILMHNKFCIIDKSTILNGSYNWTRKASSNLENLTITQDTFAANKFLQQFELLKKKATPYFENFDCIDSNYTNISFDTLLSYEQLIERAEIRQKNGNFLASLLDLKKASEINPKKGQELLFDIAYCQSELNDNENAIENYSKYLQYYPKSTGSLNNRGLLYQQQNKLNLAYQDFSAAIAIEPNIPLYYNNRADLSKELLSYYKSNFQVKPFIPILIQTPTTSEIKEMLEYNKSLEFWKKTNIKDLILKCINDYETVIKLDHNCDKLYLFSEIANVYYGINNYIKSIEYYTKAINIEPNYHYGYYSRGWNNYILDNYNNAISDIEKALKIDPHEKTYQDAIRKIRKEKLKPKNWFK